MRFLPMIESNMFVNSNLTTFPLIIWASDIILYKISLWFNEVLFFFFIDLASRWQSFSYEVKTRCLSLTLPLAYFSIAPLTVACLHIAWVFFLFFQGFYGTEYIHHVKIQSALFTLFIRILRI